MRKVLLLIVPLLIAGALFLGFLFVSSFQTEVSALQVTAIPQAEVFLDAISLGKTPMRNDKLKPGEHVLKLVPQDESSSLFAFEEKLTLRKNVLTAVDRVFKTTEAESEVSIISLEPGSNKKTIEIAVTSTPQGSEVKLDEQPQGISPLLLKDVTNSDHQITITKEGYKSKTLRVGPKEGYRLTVFGKLAIKSSEETKTEEPAEEPKPTNDSKTIRILNTPTGFLRVRLSPSTKSGELTRVNPGETFPLLEEKEGWYKIALPDKKEGWVSSLYTAR